MCEAFQTRPCGILEVILITDEKRWCVNGYFNSQNDRVRVRSKADVPAKSEDKFPASRMVWLGMSARGLTPLVWFKTKVNGTVYREKILDNIVVCDVMERDDEEAPINKRKLFENSKDFIFEQDFATPHSTNVN